MFRLFIALLFFIFCFSSVSFAAAIETASDIRAVTVYTNRAKLERRAVVDLPAGSHTVIFKDLPAGILTDSLRVEGSADTEVIFGALSHKQAFAKELTAPREKELNDRLETLQHQRQVIEAEKAALMAEKSFLENLGKQAALRSNEDIAEINLKPEQWGGASEAIRTGMAEILKNTLMQDQKIRETDKEIQKIRNELAQLRTGQKVTWQVSIPVETAAATKLTVDLSYQVNNATWQPLYDARLDTQSGALALVQYGEVRQQTGEDWNDVALTLSTAQPHRGAGLPDLNPMWVSLYRAAPGQGHISEAYRTALVESNIARTERAVRKGESFMSAPAGFAKETDAVFKAAEIETGGFVSEYKIPGPSTVPADGTESKLMVGAFETDNKIRIEVKPQLSTEAFLVARMTLKGEAPILPGRVNLFRDGAFVGQSMMALVRSGEDVSLPFGIDDQLLVKRKVLKDERGGEGLLTLDSEIERHFITELQNLHTSPVEVAVLETIPVARNEEIEVKIIEDATSRGYETDKDNVKGLLQWTVTMEPKAEKDITLGWKVSWPKDESISGL